MPFNPASAEEVERLAINVETTSVEVSLTFQRSEVEAEQMLTEARAVSPATFEDRALERCEP
jgi:hypothetical protein